MNQQTSSVISFSILTIAAAAIYYFVFFLPNQATANDLMRNQLSCSGTQAGVLATYKQNLLADNKGDLISAQNHYNRKLNKCIIEIDDFGATSGTAANGVQYSYSSGETTLTDGIENAYLGGCLVDTDTKTQKQNTVFCNDSAGNTITTGQFDTLEKDDMTQ